MGKSCLFIVSFVLLLAACSSNKVKIRGKVENLQGTVRLLAEIPEQEGLVVLAQQNVTDGTIDLLTESLQIPARVWVDIDGKRLLEIIVDSKDQIWIQGKMQFLDQIEVKGSKLDIKYGDLKKMLKDKYEPKIKNINKKIQRLADKKNQSTDDHVMTNIHHMQIARLLRARADYAKGLIEENLSQELSLLLLKDELRDSVDLQKRLFKKMEIANKESNLYMTLAEKLQ